MKQFSHGKRHHSSCKCRRTGVADKIGDLRETVANAISAVGEEWQDSKFEEFSEEYVSNKKAMEDISSEYHRYANEVLPPIIEKAKEYDQLKTSV